MGKHTKLSNERQENVQMKGKQSLAARITSHCGSLTIHSLDV